MKLIFLGTGTSQGVPMIGCDCPVCVSEDPRDTRFRTHAHVEMDGLNIQIDAAQEFRIQAIRNRLPKIDLILLTHGHADHILGMDDMRRFCDLREGAGIPIYTNEEGATRMKSIYPYAIRDRPLVHGYPAFNVQRMPEELELEQGWIRSVRQDHGDFETLGLVFEERSTGRRLAYFTDCKSVSAEAERLAKGADVVVLDALRHKPHRAHMTVADAIEAAKRIQGTMTYFVHMTHDVPHVETERALPTEIRLAYDNLGFEI